MVPVPGSGLHALSYVHSQRQRAWRQRHSHGQGQQGAGVRMHVGESAKAAFKSAHITGLAPPRAFCLPVHVQGPAGGGPDPRGARPRALRRIYVHPQGAIACASHIRQLDGTPEICPSCQCALKHRFALPRGQLSWRLRSSGVANYKPPSSVAFAGADCILQRGENASWCG